MKNTYHLFHVVAANKRKRELVCEKWVLAQDESQALAKAGHMKDVPSDEIEDIVTNVKDIGMMFEEEVIRTETRDK